MNKSLRILPRLDVVFYFYCVGCCLSSAAYFEKKKQEKIREGQYQCLGFDTGETVVRSGNIDTIERSRFLSDTAPDLLRLCLLPHVSSSCHFLEAKSAVTRRGQCHM